MALMVRAPLLRIPLVACALAVPADGFGCDFDLTGPKADRVFFTLGIRFEHPGRFTVASSTQVESLFCSEKALAPQLSRVLGALAKEQGLPGDLREETKQGCLTIFHSPSLAPRLDSCYRRGAASLDVAVFMRTAAPKDLDRRRALAYVAGAWARQRRDRAILLTAGTSKADLLATLLKARGCTNVRVERRLDAAPGSNTVHFEPTAEVSEWLNKTW
jgi:hypothetical protein